ncbi:YceI family protein [Corynebacterium zhongnanshanii]|uniref:YceI family protein n=1 Tax=Corynebacterium zhongnanshanii TaxID=2768834 RepID=A0ABQ6VM47_9CORY|nr:YceI family protein [Corynebacterium zhongnanshanii]KAB3523531.1 YceI family protein [Corynebacterium zhongnanshanii]
MRKAIITFGTIGIILCAVFALRPIVNMFVGNPGLRTASISTGGDPATTDMNGSWVIIPGQDANQSQVGYTFHEVLPAGAKETSGRADNHKEQNIKGHVTVHDDVLTEAVVSVRVDGISSDVEKRDINVRKKILETQEFPEASFTLTDPVDVSSLPKDGTTGEIAATGDLYIHGQTKQVTATFKVLRTGDNVVLSANIPFNRLDFGVKTPEFVAAKIEEQGTLDVLLVLQKS